jgi:alpha-beta hydrolase superfamily lysophospholipase
VNLDLSYRPGPAPVVVGTETIRHRTVERWSIEGSAGGDVAVDVHLPEHLERIVVMGHGADNSRAARYVEVSGKSFTRHGTAVIAMDAPRHGDRRSVLDRLPGLEAGLLEEWVRDHRILLDHVTDRWPGVPVGFTGFSMGGLFGVPLMAVDDRVAAGAVVIAGSTRVSYPDRLDLTDDDRIVLDATDPAVHAGGVNRPVLVLCAEDDGIVPVAAGEALARSFPDPARFVVLPGTHTEWGRAAEWFRTLEEFFLETLG